jgi:hypothetical protein
VARRPYDGPLVVTGARKPEHWAEAGSEKPVVSAVEVRPYGLHVGQRYAAACACSVSA